MGFGDIRAHTIYLLEPDKNLRGEEFRKMERMLPTKGRDEEAYEEIIRLVKEAGEWEKVSQMNGKRLNKEFWMGRLAEDLRKELENYVVEEEVTGVRLKKREEGE